MEEGTAAAPSDTSKGDLSASDVVVFKKPARRGNVRKRERIDSDEVVEEGGEDLNSTSGALEMMRELQRQRHRAKGVTLEAKGVGDEVDEALAAGAETTEHGLESTFTTQTDSGEVDPNMLRYIEEQMQQGDADAEGGGSRPAILDPAETELYTTPAHLLGVNPNPERNAVESSANRWLAGITEVSLGAEAKIASIEATEKAKREMMAKRMGKESMTETEREREHQMSIPANFNSNFHGHRRENAIARRMAANARHAALGQGNVPGGSTRSLASDGAAFGKFKNQVRNQKRN